MLSLLVWRERRRRGGGGEKWSCRKEGRNLLLLLIGHFERSSTQDFIGAEGRFFPCPLPLLPYSGECRVVQREERERERDFAPPPSPQKGLFLVVYALGDDLNCHLNPLEAVNNNTFFTISSGGEGRWGTFFGSHANFHSYYGCQAESYFFFSSFTLHFFLLLEAHLDLFFLVCVCLVGLPNIAQQPSSLFTMLFFAT